jgi:hypothetical protein
MTVRKRTTLPPPSAELVQLADSLLANYKKPEDLIGENGLLKQLTKMLVERALEVEMAEHLGHGKSEPVSNSTGNTRNGHSTKTLQPRFPISRIFQWKPLEQVIDCYGFQVALPGR